MNILRVRKKPKTRSSNKHNPLGVVYVSASRIGSKVFVIDESRFNKIIVHRNKLLRAMKKSMRILNAESKIPTTVKNV